VHKAVEKRFKANYGDCGAVVLSRAVLLLHLQIVLNFLSALTVLFVLFYTGSRDRIFYLALTSLTLLAAAGGTRANFAGMYRPALAFTVFVMLISPWTSIVYERIVNSSDILPMVYVIIPVQVGALFLSARAMIAIGLIQSGGFLAMLLTNPARGGYNWGSLLCFVLFATALGAITGYIIRRQYDKAVQMKVALEESERQLEDISRRDALTGLYNRRHMEEALAELVGREPRFGVAMLDVDDYKAVNDKYGHACGDEIIRKIADVIASTLAPGDVAFRYGGDEFLITLAGADAEAAVARGEAVRQAVEGARFVCPGAGRVGITVSMGVSFFPDCGVDRAAVLRAADRALYAAKHCGKNRVMTCAMLEDPARVPGA
jgi:diguanylate cyclase (GGDEF)-like protein